MVQTKVAQNIVKRTGGAGFGIPGSENDARDPGMHDGAGTHEAGLKGAIQRRADKSIVSKPLCGVAHGDDFRVSRGIVGGNRMIVAAAHNLTVGDNNRADWNLPGRPGLSRLCERLFHEIVVHSRMLNYPAMKPFRTFLLVLFAALPLAGFAQGVRMPADFLPLDVGTTWTYELTNEAGQKGGQLKFGVEEYTIVQGTSFYGLTGFPFTEEDGEPIRLVRYDRAERQFMRKRGADEGPLFLDSGATTEVIESDAAGTPQKFILHTDTMALTFQRGVGIIEAKLKRAGGLVIAKMTGLETKNPNAATALARGNPTASVPSTPRPTDRAVVPSPAPVPDRRASPTATVTSRNPAVDVGATPSPAGHDIVMIATNTSESLLPFRFGSGQTYDFVISDAAGKEVWRWSHDQFFTQVVRSDSIRGKDKWRFDVVWDHRDNDGNKVPPGRYRLVGIIKSLPEVRAVPVTLDVR